MDWLRTLMRKIRAAVRRSELEREMDEEMRQHLELEAEHLVRSRGLPPAEALRQARLAFGGIERFKEAARDVRRFRWLEDGARDIRFAARTLRRSPGYTLASISTLALGIGAATAAFTLVNGILLRPLPYPEPDRLVAIKHTAPGLGLEETGVSGGLYLHYRSQASSLESLGLYFEDAATVTYAGGELERIRIAQASGPEIFEVLGVRPALGRPFLAEDTEPYVANPRASIGALGAPWTVPVLLSHTFWEERFGGDSAVIGRTIQLEGNAREVVGVLPAGFDFPHPDTRLWILAQPIRENWACFACSLDYHAVGRVRPGVKSAEAERELTRLVPSIQEAFRDATRERIEEAQISPIVVPLRADVVRTVAAALWIVLAGMAFLLLAAWANVAGLTLVRSEYRRREVAVRAALGARGGELLRPFVAEGVLVAAAGGAVGLLLAWYCIKVTLAYSPIELPRLHEVKLDSAGFGFAAGAAVFAAALAGLVAALRHAGALRAPALGGAAGRFASRTYGQMRFRGALVATQVAVTLVLLVGSGLMLKSFARLMQVDRGFDPDRALIVEINRPYSEEWERVYAELLDQLRGLPGVRATAGVTRVPLAGAGRYQSIGVVADASGTVPPLVSTKYFTPGYFEAMSTPALEGSTIPSAGSPPSPAEFPKPVVVSSALARRLFPEGDALGQPIRRLNSDGSVAWTADPVTGERDYAPYTIAGVVADVREESPRGDPAEIVYVPLMLEPRVDPSWVVLNLTLVLRTDVPPLSLTPAVRQTIRDADQAIVVRDISTMDDIVAASVARERLLAVLLLVAGTASLLLGAIAVYGVVAYAVRRRVPEIGVRLALGARPAHVVRMAMLDSFRIVLVGLVLGLALALAGARVLGSLLFEVGPTDPVTLVLAATVLTAAALAAGLVPAWRATQIDPMVALRAE